MFKHTNMQSSLQVLLFSSTAWQLLASWGVNMCAVCQIWGLCLSSSSSRIGFCLWFEALRVSQSRFNLSVGSSWQPSNSWQRMHIHTHLHAHIWSYRHSSIISMLISREPDRDRARDGGNGGCSSWTTSLAGSGDQRSQWYQLLVKWRHRWMCHVEQSVKNMKVFTTSVLNA